MVQIYGYFLNKTNFDDIYLEIYPIPSAGIIDERLLICSYVLIISFLAIAEPLYTYNGLPKC